MLQVEKMIVVICMFLPVLLLANAEIVNDDVSEEFSGLYTIEGKVFPPDMPQQLSPYVQMDDKWQQDITVSINSGEYKGFLQEDGSFIISTVPSGSYVLEVQHPDYFYEPLRVEINPKGKFRARKVNYVQPSQILQVPYPLRMRALTRFKYFQQREQWKITDLLMNPMVLMMVLPLLLMMVLPKMINDPETKKEIENMQFPKMGNDMPEISEMITSLFTGSAPKQLEKEKKPLTNKQSKKRN